MPAKVRDLLVETCESPKHAEITAAVMMQGMPADAPYTFWAGGSQLFVRGPFPRATIPEAQHERISMRIYGIRQALNYIAETGMPEWPPSK